MELLKMPYWFLSELTQSWPYNWPRALTNSTDDGLFSSFNGISTSVGNFMLKPPLLKNSCSTVQPTTGGIKGFILFSRIIFRKWSESQDWSSHSFISRSQFTTLTITSRWRISELLKTHRSTAVTSLISRHLRILYFSLLDVSTVFFLSFNI